MGHPNSELAQGTHPSQGVGAGHPKPVHVNTSRGHNKCQVSQWSVHLPTRWSWVVSPSRQILRIGLGFHIDLVKLGTRKCPRDVKVVVVMLTTSFVVCRLLYKKNGAVHTQNNQSHGDDFFCSWHQALSFRVQMLWFRVRNPRRTTFILKKISYEKIVAFRKKWETTKRKGSKAKKKKKNSHCSELPERNNSFLRRLLKLNKYVMIKS